MRTSGGCKNIIEEGGEVRRGPWTLEEDSLLRNYIVRHGQGRWNMLAKCAGLKRTGKSCRLRWLNYLKPDTKRGNLTPQEQVLILELHSKWGNSWSKIAQHLPGRTDNEIKNYWRTRVQKQARLLNIESSGKHFLEAVRCFWTPRLLHKMEQTSYSSSNAPPPSSNFPDVDNFQPTLPHQTSICMSPPSPIPNFTQTSTPSHQSFESLAYNSVPGIGNSYSLDFSEQVQLLQNPPTQIFSGAWGEDGANAIASSSYGYNLESSCGYDDMVGNSTVASTSAVSDPYYDSPGECQMANAEWAPYAEMANGLWDMDDIWQLRDELNGGGPSRVSDIYN